MGTLNGSNKPRTPANSAPFSSHRGLGSPPVRGLPPARGRAAPTVASPRPLGEESARRRKPFPRPWPHSPRAAPHGRCFPCRTGGDHSARGGALSGSDPALPGSEGALSWPALSQRPLPAAVPFLQKKSSALRRRLGAWSPDAGQGQWGPGGVRPPPRGPSALAVLRLPVVPAGLRGSNTP